MRTMKRIPEYVTKVLNGIGISKAELPDEFRSIPSEQIDDSDTNKLMSKIFMERDNGFIALVTKKESVAALINALNMNLTSNKIVVICNGKVDSSALETELKERSLTDKNGCCYYPEETEYKGLYHDGSRIILKTNDVSSENVLYTYDSTVFGIILDKCFCYENIMGTTDHYLEELSIKEKAKLFMELVRNDKVNSFSDVIMLKDVTEHLFIPLPAEGVHTSNIYYSYLELFTGIRIDSNFGDAIISLSGANLPAAVSEDINRIITNKYVSAKVKLPSEELVLNTMKRLLIAE